MSGAGPGARFAARSGVLLATALALGLAALVRLTQAEWPAMAPGPTLPTPALGVWGALEGLEPGNGPAAPTAAVPDPTAAPAPDARPAAPAPEDPATVEALEALAAELGRRETAVAEREHRLALREAVMASVEERIAQATTRLEALKADLERLTGELAADEKARIAQLVKVYEAMKAKNAAAIFEPMPLDLLLPIVRGMRETKVAAIVAEMDPAKARALTAELARKTAPP